MNTPVSNESLPAGTRRWEQIASSLRADIASGHFPPGSRLPNEAQLAERFAVNRHTLRQAVQALVREGFVSVRQGSGTWVRELVLDYALQRRTRLSQNLAEAGERAERELLGHESAQPAGVWAQALKLPPHGRVELLHTRSRVRGRPISLSTAAYPSARFSGIAEVFAQERSVTATLQRFGVSDYTRLRSSISARLPTASEADALARALTQPLLVVQYTNVDPEGVPVEAATTLFAADAVQLQVEAGDGLA
ncbi:MAG: phosphonate metabolism transcriptional regulator PhnF [Inhella sp.]